MKDKKDDITGKVRSPLVEANGSVWFATDEGILYKVTLSSDGKVTEKATISLPDKGNAIISILEGKVFVTGGSGQGYIAVYSESDATEILSQKTDHPVVSQAVTKSGENFYVYFTQEEDYANLYVAKFDADKKMTVETVYTSETKKNGEDYLLIGDDGKVYYGNTGNGTITSVDVPKEENPEPKPPVEPDPNPPVEPENPDPQPPARTGRARETGDRSAAGESIIETRWEPAGQYTRNYGQQRVGESEYNEESFQESVHRKFRWNLSGKHSGKYC